MSNPEAAVRMALWAIVFSEFDIQYQPCMAIKRQVIANFITECTFAKDQVVEESPKWSVHMDRSSNR